MRKDTQLKPIYKPPQVFKLDGPETSFGQQACAIGSNPFSICRNGNSAVGSGSICEQGNGNSGLRCSRGNGNTTGTCIVGGNVIG